MAPKIENAPGIAWRPRKVGWEARWRARQDLIDRGYRPKHVRLWVSRADEMEPSALSAAEISDRCNALQTEMLVWSRGGIPKLIEFDGSIGGLIRSFQTDPDSSYRKARYASRKHYDALCTRIERDLGDRMIEDLTARDMLRWNRSFGEHVPMASSCMRMLRIVCTFGATILGDGACKEFRATLSGMRFEGAKPRSQHLTFAQVLAIRAKAHEMGWPSIALAQVLGYELTLRQKDVIGEFLPMDEPGVAPLVTDGNSKWARGLDWSEIDKDWTLRHVTSKRQKEIVVSLLNAPMVIEELGSTNRSDFPIGGPLVINEQSGMPWTASRFRFVWRQIATAVGVPKTVRNMDTRSGAITEAIEAGAQLEAVRKTATHSDISMTQRYSRGDQDAIAAVMKARNDARNKDRSQ